MNESVIPDDVRQFVLESIDSVVELECVLLFYREPDVLFNAQNISKRLYIDLKDADATLLSLAYKGFVIPAQKNKTLYQYWPKSPELELIVSKTADIYAQYLLPVTHLIHAKSKSRVQEFANAFRMRKE